MGNQRAFGARRTLWIAALATILGPRRGALAASTATVSGAPTTHNTPAVKQYYQDALQSYAGGDYRGAIAKWTATLREDPAQQSAHTMILDARQKIAELTSTRRRRVFEFVASGRYRDALQELQALLDQDPGDPQLQTLRTRLEDLAKSTPALLPKDKAARAAILGLKGYLIIPPDLKLAHDGLRYALELAPQEEVYKDFLGRLLADYPLLTSEDPVTPGMTLLEYKNYIALHQIYDARYHLAVLTLNEILAFEPNDLLALKRLGSAYYSLGRKDEARAAWSAALKLAPRDKTLRRFLAKIRSEGSKPKTYTSSEKTP